MKKKTNKRHSLKVWPQFFGPLASGKKTFEFRRDDREFSVGDVLILQSYKPMVGFGGYFTGEWVARVVTYIARKSALIPPGFCIMSIVPDKTEVSEWDDAAIKAAKKSKESKR